MPLFIQLFKIALNKAIWGGMLGCMGLLPACSDALIQKSSSEPTAVLKITSAGFKGGEAKNSKLLFYFVQYTLDGILLEAHQIKQDYQKTVALAPGRHHLYIEKAYRGVLSGHALLDETGECFSFYINKGQTAVFNGKAVSEAEWRAQGFSGIEFTRTRSSLEKCD